MVRLELSVVIPVYNEEENILPLYTQLKKVLNSLNRDYEIIFVDDGSTDGTFEHLFDLHKRDKKLKIVQLKRNFGQSSALKAGFDNASGSVIISLDGDLQNDPEDIPLLIDKLKEGYDLVCGWRYRRQDPLCKIGLSKISNFLRRLLIDDNVHDSGCTLKALRRECLEEMELYGEMHRYIPAMLALKGFRIGEIKVRHHRRRFGKTKYSNIRIVRGFVDLLNIWFWHRYSSRPLHLFGGLGLLLNILGLILGLYAIYLKLFREVGILSTSLPVIVIILIVMGVQLLVLGILGDIIIKEYYRGKKNYQIERIVGGGFYSNKPLATR